MIRFAVLAALLASVAGCTLTQQQLDALSQDKTAVCVTQTSVWETVTVSRNWGCSQPVPQTCPAANPAALQVKP